jgi:hypothetical protein
MTTSAFDHAITSLKSVLKLAETGDERIQEVSEIIGDQKKVLARYQETFKPENLAQLTEEEFRQFLLFKNNRHWHALHRLGSAICADMPRLRQALAILLDESRPIRDRLNELVPRSEAAFVPRLGKAVLSPILLISYPDRYGVWNQVSEAAMKRLEVWPEFERGLPFGDRYERVNDTLLELAHGIAVDLWTLDALWWRIERVVGDGIERGETKSVAGTEPPEVLEEPRFGLESHLQEFLRDNWNHTDLGREWAIYEEDGDPEAGYEYPCDIGRIDLLAHHRTEPRWLVIELKRSQSSDQTVGQVLRYMGWVKERMAESGDRVEGLVIAHQADDRIRYALAATQGITLRRYEVEFRLVT